MKLLIKDAQPLLLMFRLTPLHAFTYHLQEAVRGSLVLEEKEVSASYDTLNFQFHLSDLSIHGFKIRTPECWFSSLQYNPPQFSSALELDLFTLIWDMPEENTNSHVTTCKSAFWLR